METQHPPALLFPRQAAIGPRKSTQKNRHLGARHATRRLPGEGDWYTSDRPARDLQANAPSRLPPRQHCSTRVAKYPDQKLSAHSSRPRHRHRRDTAQQTKSTPERVSRNRTRSSNSYNSLSSAGYGHPPSSAQRTFKPPFKEAGHTYNLRMMLSFLD